jgi:hypothetical protein
MPEWVAEASPIFLRGAHVVPKLISYEVYRRRDRWTAHRRLIAVYLRCECYSRFLRHPWKKERDAFFILSRTPHETRRNIFTYTLYIPIPFVLFIIQK